MSRLCEYALDYALEVSAVIPLLWVLRTRSEIVLRFIWRWSMSAADFSKLLPEKVKGMPERGDLTLPVSLDPMLPIQIAKPFSDPGWLFEPK